MHLIAQDFKEGTRARDQIDALLEGRGNPVDISMVVTDDTKLTLEPKSTPETRRSPGVQLGPENDLSTN
jgi:hypothetical protein